MATRSTMATEEKIEMNSEVPVDPATNNNDISSCEDGEHPSQVIVVSSEQIKLLLELSVEEVQSALEELLSFNSCETCLKERALSDYYVSGFWWAKQMHFTERQIEFILSLMKTLLDNLQERQMTLVENFDDFAKVVTRSTQASVEESSNEPSDEANPLFDVDQAINITDYFKTSFFQHHKLYEFLCNHPREELTLSAEENVHVINPEEFILPLEEGMLSSDISTTEIPVVEEEPPQQVDVLQDVIDEKESKSETEDPFEQFTAEDVRELLSEVTKEVLGSLQADFSQKLQVQEEIFTTRINQLKNASSKQSH